LVRFGKGSCLSRARYEYYYSFSFFPLRCPCGCVSAVFVLRGVCFLYRGMSPSAFFLVWVWMFFVCWFVGFVSHGLNGGVCLLLELHQATQLPLFRLKPPIEFFQVVSTQWRFLVRGWFVPLLFLRPAFPFADYYRFASRVLF